MTVRQPGDSGPEWMTGLPTEPVTGRNRPMGQGSGSWAPLAGGPDGNREPEDAPPTRSIRRLARRDPAGVISPSRFDPVVRMASQVIGGPAGRRLASTTGVWRAATVLVLLSVFTLGFGVVQKEHCRARGWNTPDQFWHACYSDIPVLYGSVGLAGSGRPGLVSAVDSGTLGPPLQATAMWAVSTVVDGGKATLGPRRYFDLSAIVLGGALVITVMLVTAAGDRRPWDAAHVALAPVVVTAGLLSYDLLAVALVTGSLVAWSRRRPLAAGILLGLAVDTRPLTAVIGVAVLAVALRAGRLREGAVFGAAAAACWLGIRLVLFPGLGAGLSHAWQAWKAGTAGYGSIWLVPQLLADSRPDTATWWYTGPALSASAATTASLLGIVAVLAVGVVLTLVTRDRPRIAHVALFMLAGTLLVSKSVPVQASLLLVPLVALCGLRWRDHLLWAAAEVSYFVGTWLYIAASTKPDRGLPAGFYLVLLLWRLAMFGWLAVLAARRSLEPSRDPVRAPEDGSAGADDPLGGPVDRAEDMFVIRVV